MFITVFRGDRSLVSGTFFCHMTLIQQLMNVKEALQMSSCWNIEYYSCIYLKRNCVTKIQKYPLLFLM